MIVKISILFSVLFLSISLAKSETNLLDFLECVPKHVNSYTNSLTDFIYPFSDPSFSSLLTAYIKNRRFLTASTPKPLAIVTALDQSHVQATVICAKKHSLQVRIRSGGHDDEGLSYTSQVPYVVLDMFNLRKIEIDLKTETAWVQAGATLGELYHKIANTSNVHAFPAGVCTTVGTGGHFSGGGYGNLMRKYGLSVDNIIDAQIVDVNGKILNRKSMGEDVFWAIRGGGGASFGVILAWKINLVRVPEIVTVLNINKTLEQGATDLVYRWQQVASNLDKDIFIRVEPQIQNGSRPRVKTIRVDFIGLFLGQSEALLPLLNKSFPELGLKKQDCHEMRWVESVVVWAAISNDLNIDILLDRPNTTDFNYKRKSDYVREIIPKEGLETIWKQMLKVDKMFIQWNPYGGRMSEIPESETPFPHRKGILFKIQHFALWKDDGEKISNHYIKLLREYYEALAPYMSKNPREAFLNYRDLDIGSNPSNVTNLEEAEVYGHKFFKNNYLRLTQAKAKIDPENFFKHEQSIPPSKSI